MNPAFGLIDSHKFGFVCNASIEVRPLKRTNMKLKQKKIKFRCLHNLHSFHSFRLVELYV